MMMLVLTLVVVMLLLLASPHPAVHLAGNAAWLASGNPGPGHGNHQLVSQSLNCLIFGTKLSSYLKYALFLIAQKSHVIPNKPNDVSVYVLVPTVVLHCNALPGNPKAQLQCWLCSGQWPSVIEQG